MKVKICGITNADDAAETVRAGSDAVGLNFYSGSPRCVQPETALAIARSLPPFVEPVGLFVNEVADTIRNLSEQVGLCTLQLHGDEPPELLAQLAEFRIILAQRLGAQGLDELADYLDRCAHCGRVPDAVLIDARVEGQYGGTGRTAPWKLLADTYRRGEWPPLILAGGLTPENVADAIALVRPWAVDVSSGVEHSPGRKCPAKVREFIANARRAFHTVYTSDKTP